ncbi:MAG: alanine/ornithine racemase family PLP-dependent enzyme [Candidatus Muiribacteriaceae bacterium]
MYPRLNIHLERITENSRLIGRMCKKQGISLFGVTKVTCADHDVARAMIRGGVERLADSRMQNIISLRERFPSTELLLLRLPMRHEIPDIVKNCDYVLVSELSTIQLLESECETQSESVGIILMLDLGDLREGIWPDSLSEYTDTLSSLQYAYVAGTGVNLACYGGVIPTIEKMKDLINYHHQLETATGRKLDIISGGNSASLPLVLNSSIPKQINMLRVGEAILLGRNVIDRSPWPGTRQDTFTFQAEIVELIDKPSVPQGEIGQDAFGNTPEYEDIGVHHRAILAAGRQDVSPDDLIPCGDYRILGGSSDHIIVDVENIRGQISVGETLEFMLTYGGLLSASTSPYVYKNHIQQTQS